MREGQNNKNVILGGFLSRAHLYSGMKSRIEEISGQETRIVRFSPVLWRSLLAPFGWRPILRRLESTLQEIKETGPNSSVTLIGHSIGGVLGLLYLISPPAGKNAGELREMIGRLITLGSPHKNRRRWLHGGRLSRTVEKHGGIDAVRHDVRITCVAGKAVLGNKHGTASQKGAYAVYRAIGGNGEVWGDGIVPLSSALIPGAKHMVLEGTAHFPVSGHAWYGSPETVSRWWTAAQSDRPQRLKEALEKT